MGFSVCFNITIKPVLSSLENTTESAGIREAHYIYKLQWHAISPGAFIRSLYESYSHNE